VSHLKTAFLYVMLKKKGEVIMKEQHEVIIAEGLDAKTISKDVLDILCGHILRVVLNDHLQQGKK